MRSGAPSKLTTTSPQQSRLCLQAQLPPRGSSWPCWFPLLFSPSSQPCQPDTLTSHCLQSTRRTKLSMMLQPPSLRSVLSSSRCHEGGKCKHVCEKCCFGICCISAAACVLECKRDVCCQTRLACRKDVTAYMLICTCNLASTQEASTVYAKSAHLACDSKVHLKCIRCRASLAL